MLNFRLIGPRFCLSGGWQNLKKDIDFLLENNVFAVLDLQFTPEDSSLMIGAVTDELEKNFIVYKSIRMFDSELNRDLDGILNEAFETLTTWEAALDKEPVSTDKPKLGGVGNNKPRLLVKCGAGVSRSVCVLTAYLCTSRRWSFDFARNWITDNEDDFLGISHAESHFFGAGIGMDPFFTDKLRKLFPEKGSAFGVKE